MTQNSQIGRRVGRGLRRALRGGVAASALAALGACDTQRLVAASDPDIISPELVNSAAAADALRIGAIGRLNQATTGGEGMFLYSGLLADEWESGDTFIERNQMDLRAILIENGNLDGGYRSIQRARVTAQQARLALAEFDPTGPAWKQAEMLFVEAYAINLMAEHFCSGVPLSTVIGGVEQPGGPVATADLYALALAKYDSALTLLGTTSNNDANRVRNLVRVERGRTLLNVNRPADAAAAVAQVPTTFEWVQEHNAAVRDNAVWSLNIAGRRYNIGTAEAGEGINFFAAADPRLPVCVGNDTTCRGRGITNAVTFNNARPLRAQLKWPERTSPVSLVNGIQARLIGAEAALRGANPAAAIDSLNALRAAFPALNLAPLTAPATQNDRVDLVFRERAFWNFGLGQRLGDMRRLIRQYGRTQAQVFPTGVYPTDPTSNYGTDVNFPIPQSEQNNPEFGTGGQCINRDA